jgi:hypothetical protein
MGDSATQPQATTDIISNTAVNPAAQLQLQASSGHRARLRSPYMTVENGKRLRALNRIEAGSRTGSAQKIFDSVQYA